MNHQITNLFRLCALGFAVLISFTAYWQIWAADSLAVRQDNARLVYRQLQIKRGLIFAANGRTVLAQNRTSKQDGQTIYTRRYPFRGLFAQVVGYNSVNQGRTGLELSYNDFLTSSNANLSTQLQNLGDSLRGRTVTGDNLVTSLSLPAQKAAMAGLGQMHGAVVAIQPSTGRVVAMASTPTFNPNHVATNFPKLIRNGAGAPLLNRATQGLYTPGSTFKTVTSTAALKSGQYTPTAPLTPAPSCIKVFVQLCNAGFESFAADRPDRRADLLGQHRVRADRPEDRLAEAAQRHGRVRLLHRPGDRPARRRGRALGSLPQRPPDLAVGAHRRRPYRDRPGQSGGDAAADGRGRGDDRQRRRADAADARGHGRSPPAAQPSTSTIRRRSSG